MDLFNDFWYQVSLGIQNDELRFKSFTHFLTWVINLSFSVNIILFISLNCFRDSYLKTCINDINHNTTKDDDVFYKM